MSYDKGKTVREYMQGGYAQSMGYSNGGYIPGVSSSLFKAGFTRDVGQAQDEQREQAEALAKHGKFRDKMIGGAKAVAGLGLNLAAPFTGGASLAFKPLIKGGLDAFSTFAGEKAAEFFGSEEYKNVGKKSSTGLLGSGFEELGDIRKKYQTGSVGRALASGFDTALKAGSKELGGALLAKAPRLFGDAGARSIGLGGDAFAKDVTAQGIADNPWLETASDADDAWAAGADYLGPERLTNIGNKYGQSMGWNTPQNLIAGINQGGVVRGYEDGGEVSSEQYAGLIGKMVGKFGGEVPEGMYTPEGGLTRAGYAKMIGASPESVNIDTMHFKNPANYSFKVSGKGAKSGVDVGGTTTGTSYLPLRALLDKTMRQNIKDPFERMDWDKRLREIKPEGYAGGGLINMLPFNRRIM